MSHIIWVNGSTCAILEVYVEYKTRRHICHTLSWLLLAWHSPWLGTLLTLLWSLLIEVSMTLVYLRIHVSRESCDLHKNPADRSGIWLVKNRAFQGQKSDREAIFQDLDRGYQKLSFNLVLIAATQRTMTSDIHSEIFSGQRTSVAVR